MKLLLCILFDHSYRIWFGHIGRQEGKTSHCARCGAQFDQVEFRAAAWGFWSRLWYHLRGKI